MFNFNTNKQQVLPTQTTSTKVMPNGNPQAANGAADAMQAAPDNQDALINNKVANLEAQRRQLMLKQPDFDIEAELENDSFATYIFANGISLEDAYFLVHRDEIIDNAVKDALSRISLRRNRIVENGVGKSSPVSVKKNPKDMSDKEIDSIVERVKNGEKISF